jgi:hypothetical protein
MKDSNYTKLDENIDKYLGTYNLRPGPPRRLVNHYLGNNKGSDNIKFNKINPEQNKLKINFSSYPSKLDKGSIKWDE